MRRPSSRVSTLVLTLFSVLAASSAPAATEYQCGTGGKPNAATKRCDCPPEKLESTDAKGVSRCVSKPPTTTTTTTPTTVKPKPTNAPKPKPTSEPKPKPTTTATSTVVFPPFPTPTATPKPTPTPTSTQAPQMPLPTATATAKPTPVPTVLAPPPKIPVLACPAGMATIQGGTFPFGGSTTLKTVVGFCLDQAEVTVKDYGGCVATKKCTEPRPFNGTKSINPTEAGDVFCNWKHPKGRETHPVNCVSFPQAESFCASVGKRVPFQPEWEWAARGGAKATTYPWGNQAPSAAFANVCGAECPPNMRIKAPPLGDLNAMFLEADAYPETSPVGAFPLGNSSLFDMAGNVSEWTMPEYTNSMPRMMGSSFRSGDLDNAKVHATFDGTGFWSGIRCALTPD